MSPINTLDYRTHPNVILGRPTQQSLFKYPYDVNLEDRPMSGVAIVRGTRPVAMGAVGATVRGIPAESVIHLRLVEETGIGTCNLRRIEIIGESVEKMQKKSKVIFREEARLNLVTLACLNGDIQQEED